MRVCMCLSCDRFLIACERLYVYVWAFVCACVHSYIHVSVCVRVWDFLCACLYMAVHVGVCMCVCIFAYVRACVCVEQ